MALINENVRSVANSLRNEPEDWSFGHGGFELVHKSGLVVWIANKTYGLGICSRSLGPALWGGVTMLSSVGLSPSHHVLGSAVRAWKRWNAARMLAA